MRHTILRVAHDLFAAHGFENVTLDDIAATARITRHHLRGYFTSTEAMRAPTATTTLTVAQSRIDCPAT